MAANVGVQDHSRINGYLRKPVFLESFKSVLYCRA